MPSFAVSIATLSLLQAVLVALPKERRAFGWMPRSPWWALVPAGSIVVVVFGIEVLPGSADGLAWLALVAVPPLAALSLGWLIHGARPTLALAAAPLFALAWAAQGSLAGEVAATALSALACVALGWLLVSVVLARWLRWGVYAMAAIDAVLVGAELLQGPSGVLVAADPGGLPRLQVLEFGAARMGFGDAFLAATVGCLLVASRPTPADGPMPSKWRTFQARRQRDGVLLVAALGLGFDLLFFALETLPATVPVALALALVEWRERRRESAAGLSAGGRSA
ncbi:MAG TPA: hypothetical protein VFU04_02785 [Solirubrobacterales bacterium]|nr:hypothetical protein [Solirubrobacterales bacterium]